VVRRDVGEGLSHIRFFTESHRREAAQGRHQYNNKKQP